MPIPHARHVDVDGQNSPRAQCMSRLHVEDGEGFRYVADDEQTVPLHLPTEPESMQSVSV